jgi:hypothetical protein
VLVTERSRVLVTRRRDDVHHPGVVVAGRINTETLSKWLSRAAVAAGRSPAVADRKCLA